MTAKILRQEIFTEASKILVGNSWDLPTPGRVIDPIGRYHGPDNSVREATKETARKMQKSTDVRQQVIGYVLESRAHFFESEERAINQCRKHPDFEEYFWHWFYSDPDYVAEPARAYFTNWFSRPTSLKVEPRKIYWHSQQRNKHT